MSKRSDRKFKPVPTVWEMASNEYRAFKNLSEKYPGDREFTIDGERLQYWQICTNAQQNARDTDGADEDGSDEEQYKFWSAAIGTLKMYLDSAGGF